MYDGSNQLQKCLKAIYTKKSNFVPREISNKPELK